MHNSVPELDAWLQSWPTVREAVAALIFAPHQQHGRLSQLYAAWELREAEQALNQLALLVQRLQQDAAPARENA